MAMVVVDKTKSPIDIEAKPGLVGGKYYADKRIGEGSFGVIYKGVECRGNYRVAIKFENRQSVVPQLRDEYRTYRMLNEFQKRQEQVLHQKSLKDGQLLYGGAPQVYYFGQDSIYNCLVMDLLGPSLEELFDQCGRKFTVPTVCQVAIQMLYLIEMIHNCGLIYRDIKPDNFLIGANNLIYVVDFGMAKAYLDPRTLQHIPYREKKSLSGTARYMSINTHLGREQSRRDDLEALGHVFFYFLRGSLPWQGLTAASNKEKYEKIGMKKQDISVGELCNGLPDEFAKYLQYARSLKFDAQPDYEMLRGLMGSVMERYGPISHFKYDWSQYRSTWEPELLAKVSEGELSRLKNEAMLLGASSPLSPSSLASSSPSCPYTMNMSGPGSPKSAGYNANVNNSSSYYQPPLPKSQLQSNHRSVAVFRDDLRDEREQQFPYQVRANRLPHEMEGNSRDRRSWLRRLFCL